MAVRVDYMAENKTRVCAGGHCDELLFAPL